MLQAAPLCMLAPSNIWTTGEFARWGDWLVCEQNKARAAAGVQALAPEEIAGLRQALTRDIMFGLIPAGSA